MSADDFALLYGVDTPRKAELIAAQMSVEEVCKYIEADSLGYLSIEGMRAAIGIDEQSSCTACWSGKYPTLIAKNIGAANAK